MNLRSPNVPLPRTRRGVTLIELTVIILVLLSISSVLFVGMNAWKRGSDRANCIMQIRNIQTAVRSYANLNGLDEGANTALMSPPVSLQGELIGSSKFIEQSPFCPAGGLYTFTGNTIPALGTLYMTCSLESSDDHVPNGHDTW